MAIVCICRGTRSGGHEMARCLAARLRYPMLGREVLQNAAARLGVSEEMLTRKMVDRPRVWSRFSSLRRTYVLAVQTALAERAVGGRLVYHGLAGGLLLRGLPGTFCVRLIAPMEDRIRAVMRDSTMDAANAERYIREVDEARARWVRVMYGEDIMDPSLYDLVINLETLSIGGACAIVARTLQEPELAVTEDVRARLQDFHTACRVKLTLAQDPELGSLELDAEAEGGAVTVSGEAPLRKNGRTGDRIAQLARSVPGVDVVHLRIEWFDPYP